MGKNGKGKKKSSAEAYRELVAQHMTSLPPAVRPTRTSSFKESRLESQRLYVAHGRLEDMPDMFSSRARGGVQRRIPPLFPRRSSAESPCNSFRAGGSHWQQPLRNPSPLVTGSDTSIRDCVAVDCEMVGTGMKGSVSMLGRCSVVNHHGHVLYDTYVAPLAPVTDYRTCFSGIRKHNLMGAPPFYEVQSRVKELLRGKRVIGHDLTHDFTVLDITHPKADVRDTCKYSFSPFQKNANVQGKSKLQTLLKNVNGVTIQCGEHCSVEDAQAAMLLYQSAKVEWERVIRT